MIEEERLLKRNIKKLTEELVVKTKQVIENLTDEQVKNFLKLKWIDSLCSAILTLPESIVSELEKRIDALTKRYSVTLLDIESEIKECEQSFSALIDDLTGDEYDMQGLKELQALLRGEK